MGEIVSWIVPVIAAGTVLGSAAVAYSAVARLEKIVSDHTKDIQDMKVDVAVLQSQHKGD